MRDIKALEADLRAHISYAKQKHEEYQEPIDWFYNRPAISQVETLLDTIEQQRAAIASYEAARETGWLSMDSAPKDGTEFQAWIGEYGWEPKCRINPESEAFEIWGRVDYDQENWDVYSHLTPTHWQPNPAAPLPEQEPRP